MKLVLVTFLIIISAGVSGQNYSHQKIAGFKCPVKTYTSVTYKNLTFNNGVWEPADTADFYNRYTCYYNIRGDEDSIHSESAVPDIYNLGGEPRIMRLVIIYQYKDTLKTGSKTYEDGKLIETAQISWPDKYTERKMAYDEKGRPKYMTETKLDKYIRIKEIHFTSYDTTGEVSYGYKETWTLGSDGWLSKVSRVYLDEEEEEIKLYEHENNDTPCRTPLKAIIRLEGEDAPDKISIRSFVYY